jgi:hypothetical protein
MNQEGLHKGTGGFNGHSYGTGFHFLYAVPSTNFLNLTVFFVGRFRSNAITIPITELESPPSNPLQAGFISPPLVFCQYSLTLWSRFLD